MQKPKSTYQGRVDRFLKDSAQESQPASTDQLVESAKTSLGTSRFSGFRGLIPDKGLHNHESQSLGGWLENADAQKDSAPESTQLFQAEEQRAQREREQAQTSLDKAASGPRRGVPL